MDSCFDCKSPPGLSARVTVGAVAAGVLTVLVHVPLKSVLMTETSLRQKSTAVTTMKGADIKNEDTLISHMFLHINSSFDYYLQNYFIVLFIRRLTTRVFHVSLYYKGASQAILF